METVRLLVFTTLWTAIWAGPLPKLSRRVELVAGLIPFAAFGLRVFGACFIGVPADDPVRMTVAPLVDWINGGPAVVPFQWLLDVTVAIGLVWFASIGNISRRWRLATIWIMPAVALASLVLGRFAACSFSVDQRLPEVGLARHRVVVGAVEDSERGHVGREGGDHERGAGDRGGVSPRLVRIAKQQPHRQERGHPLGDRTDALEGRDEHEPRDGLFRGELDGEAAAEAATHDDHVGSGGCSGFYDKTGGGHAWSRPWRAEGCSTYRRSPCQGNWATPSTMDGRLTVAA
jgi:hypothetical protein